VVDRPIFPTKSFGEDLPTLTDLPELQVGVDMTSIEFAFRNPRATISCVITRETQIFRWDGVAIWGALPLRTVLVVDVFDPQGDADNDEWFIELLRDLVNLEHLEFRGERPAVVRRLCQRATGGDLHVPIQTLVARAAEEYLVRGARVWTRHRRPHHRNLHPRLCRVGREGLDARANNLVKDCWRGFWDTPCQRLWWFSPLEDLP